MVWTGRQTLGSIEQTLGKVRDQIKQVDEQIQTTSRELVALQQQEGARSAKLAEIRLDQLISGEIVAGLNAADRRVTELLGERDRALDGLQEQLEGERQQQVTLEEERETQSDRVADAAKALDTAEAEVQKRLSNDPEYKAQFDKARQTDNVARHAEEKTAQAETDRVEKGKAYESDPLFSYLWKRAYGTSRYSANSLISFLDNWVAQRCDYHNARPNYAMLLEIPKRLRDHAERVRAAAEDEFGALKALEETAAENGGVPAVREALSEAERRLDEIDDQIRANEERVRDLMKQRAIFAAGEDEYFHQCIDTLSAAFQREKLAALHEYARATATAEDDVLVYELADLDAKKNDLEHERARHKEMYERQLSRLQELENVRQRFKRERFDDIHSVFGNADLLTLILSQFLQGMASGDDLWQTIRRGQRYRRIRANPGFGSGRFGSGGVWRFPFPGGGPRGRCPGGGSFGSGGGFRTGGGF
jgi:chromosome segregation ATPase